MNENIMKALGFSKEMEDIKNGKCPFCGKVITENDFENRSEIYKREFKISGLCPNCQDSIFNEN